MLAYDASRELIPFFGLYAIYFRDHGLSATAVSTLFVVWSVTTFVLEIPSGAWADTVDRRRLLVLGAALLAVAFTVWLAVPTYVGFAIGFVLWGVSSALTSGTFEALVFDELASRGSAVDYQPLIAWARSLETGAVLVATLAATPLFVWGGYRLVGWSSVVVAVLHTGLALALPRAPASASAAPDGRYLAMLGEGLREVARGRRVLGAVVVVAVVAGCSAYDEYVGLVARDHGVGRAGVPLVTAVVVAGQLLGAASAARSTRTSGARTSALVVLAAVMTSLGAVAGSWLAMTVGITLGLGVLAHAAVIAETRLQAVIDGPARATVTSVSGLASEVVALVAFGCLAVGTTWWSSATVLALWGLPILAAAVAARRLLPEPPAAPSEVSG